MLIRDRHSTSGWKWIHGWIRASDEVWTLLFGGGKPPYLHTLVKHPIRENCTRCPSLRPAQLILAQWTYEMALCFQRHWLTEVSRIAFTSDTQLKAKIFPSSTEISPEECWELNPGPSIGKAPHSRTLSGGSLTCCLCEVKQPGRKKLGCFILLSAQSSPESFRFHPCCCRQSARLSPEWKLFGVTKGLQNWVLASSDLKHIKMNIRK